MSYNHQRMALGDPDVDRGNRRMQERRRARDRDTYAAGLGPLQSFCPIVGNQKESFRRLYNGVIILAAKLITNMQTSASRY